MRSRVIIPLMALVVVARPVAAEPDPSAAQALSLAGAVELSASYCQNGLDGTTTDLPWGTTTYVDVSDETIRRIPSIQHISTVPELVKRYVASSSYGSVHGANKIVRLLSHGGEVWMLTYHNVSACEVMVTAADDAVKVAEGFIGRLGETEAWEISEAALPDAQNQVTEYVLLKPRPQADNRNRIYRLYAAWLGHEQSDKSGVQFEMSFLAGTKRK